MLLMLSVDLMWFVMIEFKVKLPMVLHEKHHLLLTVYSYNPKKMEERAIVGHVIIPLFKNGR